LPAGISRKYGTSKSRPSSTKSSPRARSIPIPPTSLPVGPEGQKQLFTKYNAAFPDSRFTVDAIIAEGDLVAVRWSVRGTHQGILEGLAATRKQVNLTGTATMRIVSGKIAEMWNNWDALGLLQQLGVVARAQGA